MDLEKYRKSQVNGTIYITTRQVLDEKLSYSLQTGAGEIFLTNIPRNGDVTPEHIMEVACQLGEIYALRFKIDFAGISRGYAYLQYIDEGLKENALQQLPYRFQLSNMNVMAMASINTKELLLRNVQHLTPVQVYQELRKLCSYVGLRVYEVHPNEYLYAITYRNNNVAALAHQTLRGRIGLFGEHAYISWLSQKHRLSATKVSSACCQQLDRQGDQLLGLLNPQECNCFQI